MFCVIDRVKNMSPIKSGFITAAKANAWAKKNLPKDEVHLWGAKWNSSKIPRYLVTMK